MFKTSLILLTLSLTTLSLPTGEQGLQKRWADGWISSYDLPDGSCKTQVSQRPKWSKTACISFTPTTARIGKCNLLICALYTHGAIESLLI